MIKLTALLLMTLLAPAAFCELTVDQKVADFMQIAGLYARNYSFSQWKKDVMGFDLFDVKSWLDRVKASADDLAFFDICVDYVASLQDSHDEYFLNTDFMAYLPVTMDLFDNRVLIDSINRTLLPAADYPMQVGDELVSLDGKGAEELIQEFTPFAVNGSGGVTSRRRMAVQSIWWRQQKWMPRAPQVGETATIVVRDQNGGLATYTVPWLKIGTPIWHAAPTPSLRASAVSPIQQSTQRQAEALPPYLEPLRSLQISGTAREGYAQTGVLEPAFNVPPGFQIRLGMKPEDQFVTGAYRAGEHRIGYLRIPTMEPNDQSAALRQFVNEIAYFNQNTDALVIDLMGNGGGDVCYAETLARYLFPSPFRGVFSRVRATQDSVWVYSQALAEAKKSGAAQSVVDLYAGLLNQMQSALNRDGGLTEPIRICSVDAEAIHPVMATDGSVFSYAKPILVLIDDLTLSSAEVFAMFMQDESRGKVFGVRTGGGGGNPTPVWLAGVYSEGNVRITRSIFTRKHPVATPGFPAVDHIENTGIYPDIVNDFMTRDNLMSGGKGFVDAFSRTVVNMIEGR